MTKLFRMDNTEGYDQNELDKLNAEWEARALELGLEEGTRDYEIHAKHFADEVARR